MKSEFRINDEFGIQKTPSIKLLGIAKATQIDVILEFIVIVIRISSLFPHSEIRYSKFVFLSRFLLKEGPFGSVPVCSRYLQPIASV